MFYSGAAEAPEPRELAPVRQAPPPSQDGPVAPGRVIESPGSGVRYTVERGLGAGCFGQVWLCREDARGEGRAVKVMRAAGADEVRAEVEVLRRATEVYGVPKFYETCDGTVVGAAGQSVMIISTELIDGASAGSCVRRRALPAPVWRVLLNDVCRALKLLHGAGIIHRDVKGDNILISRSGIGYLCDFGTSTTLRDLEDPENEVHNIGTPFFMAPELACYPDPLKFSEKVDIWALGITAIELATGKPPLQDGPRVQTCAFQVFRLLLTGPEPGLPEDHEYPFDFRLFVDGCLVRDPAERSSAEDLLSGEYLGGRHRPTASAREFVARWFQRVHGEGQ